jgi:hypothetical protein
MTLEDDGRYYAMACFGQLIDEQVFTAAHNLSTQSS